MNDRSFGWMSSRKTAQDMIMMKNHGFGLSWGIPLRRGYSSFSSLKG